MKIINDLAELSFTIFVIVLIVQKHLGINFFEINQFGAFGFIILLV
jgi:hypothetical protein